MKYAPWPDEALTDEYGVIHEPGCPTVSDDESDTVLYDYMQCGCSAKIEREVAKAVHESQEG